MEAKHTRATFEHKGCLEQRYSKQTVHENLLQKRKHGMQVHIVLRWMLVQTAGLHDDLQVGMIVEYALCKHGKQQHPYKA